MDAGSVLNVISAIRLGISLIASGHGGKCGLTGTSSTAYVESVYWDI